MEISSMSTRQPLLDLLSTEHLHADLKGRSVRGGMLTVTSQGTQFILQSVATVVLARLLTPADFGLVAMVTAITGLGQAFADLGLSEATIQRHEISHDQVSVLFWINVAIGLGLMLVTIGLAPVLGWFYRQPRLISVTLISSFTFLIGGLRVQHDALLKRQMRFVSMAIRDVTAYAIAVPVAITLAWRGAGYWAIVSLPLTLNFIVMALSWLMVRWIPGLPRRGTNVRSMIAFGGNVAASYLMSSVNRSVDSVLIGWYWGAHPLGLYSRAYNLLMLPVRQLSGPARSVTVPAFSRLQNDPERLARFYLRAANLIMWITTPIFGFLFVAAQPVIVLVLGHQWGEAAPVFQILVISALGQLLFDSSLWLFISRGESARLFKLLLVMSPIIVGSFAIGLPFGIKGVALSGSVALVVSIPWQLRYAFRGTPLTLQRLAKAIYLPIVLSLGGIALAWLALRLMAPHGIAGQLLVPLLGFAAAYSLSALVRPVREEAMSLKSLLSELRLSSRTA
jgi:O-antigen/teichoic acid export membrane protein